MANLWLCLAAVLLNLQLAIAVCEDACSPIATLLSKCSLPPLSTDFGSVGKPKTRPHGGSTFGPSTYFIDSVQQAHCFCSGARDSFADCTGCFDGDGGLKQNNAEITKLYQGDCLEFGYFVNDTLAYPSTTRAALPSSTASSDDTCPETDTCSLLRSQIADCDLTSLDGADESASPYSFTDKVLLNRTAAECLCTLPVLRRMKSCSGCLSAASRGKLTVIFGIVKAYDDGCYKFGYYPDSKEVQPDTTSSSKTSDGPSPTTTGNAEEDAGSMLWNEGALALLAIGFAISMFPSFGYGYL